MLNYVKDDGGRADAGYKGEAGDCVTRALAIVSGEPYRELYRELARAQQAVTGKRSARNGIKKKAYEAVFQGHGLVKVKLPKGPRPTYAQAHERYGDCIVTTARHVCALVDGALHDTFDGRTYEWLEKVCNECVDDGDLAGSWQNSRDDFETCPRCGDECLHGGMVEVNRERKAQGVWVKGESA